MATGAMDQVAVKEPNLTLPPTHDDHKGEIVKPAAHYVLRYFQQFPCTLDQITFPSPIVKHTVCAYMHASFLSDCDTLVMLSSRADNPPEAVLSIRRIIPSNCHTSVPGPRPIHACTQTTR